MEWELGKQSKRARAKKSVLQVEPDMQLRLPEPLRCGQERLLYRMLSKLGQSLMCKIVSGAELRRQVAQLPVDTEMEFADEDQWQTFIL